MAEIISILEILTGEMPRRSWSWRGRDLSQALRDGWVGFGDQNKATTATCLKLMALFFLSFPLITAEAATARCRALPIHLPRTVEAALKQNWLSLLWLAVTVSGGETESWCPGSYRAPSRVLNYVQLELGFSPTLFSVAVVSAYPEIKMCCSLTLSNFTFSPHF